MDRYDPHTIEPKWQRIWADEHTWEVSNDFPDERPKSYVLEMLPYTSGEPHIGHLKNYAVGDAVAHFHRRQGMYVLHPMGYDAPVGERGEGLSGGQRQAIALARAMLLKPAVMVCDEPTNAMDIEAERAFTQHIREQVGDKTLILITHRQNLLTLVDRLILLDQGKVIIDGPRDEVIAALASGQVKVREPQKEVAETP